MTKPSLALERQKTVTRSKRHRTEGGWKNSLVGLWIMTFRLLKVSLRQTRKCLKQASSSLSGIVTAAHNH